MGKHINAGVEEKYKADFDEVRSTKCSSDFKFWVQKLKKSRQYKYFIEVQT